MDSVSVPKREFFYRPTYVLTLKDGTKFDIPVKYWNSNSVTALFWADYEKTKSLTQGVSVVRFPGNKALISVVFFSYGGSTIGEYNECAVSAIVVPEGEEAPPNPLEELKKTAYERKIGVFNIDLPVSTELAYKAGYEVVGLPKFVTKIEYQKTADSFYGSINDPDLSGEKIIELTGHFGDGCKLGNLSDIVILLKRENKQYRIVTELPRDAVSYECDPNKFSFELKVSSTSEHHMAKHFRALALSPKPFSVSFANDFDVVFNQGVFI